MEDENMVTDDTLNVQDTDTSPETVSQVDLEELKKRADLAENYKIRAEKAERALKTKPQTIESPVDSVDLIKLGKKLQDYSDNELDFVTDYAKSKKPEDILKALENPFIQQGIKAQREQLEKEKLALTPSSAQSDSDRPRTLGERLVGASLEEKEKILTEMGMYKSPRPRSDRVYIGKQN